MKLECASCSTRYTIDDTIIPPLGAKVRCRKCGNVIAVPARTESAEPVVPAPTATPVVPPPARPFETPSPAPFTPNPSSFASPSPAASAPPSPELPPVSYTASAPVAPPTPPVAPASSGFSFFPSDGAVAPAAQAAPQAPAPAPPVSAGDGSLSADEKKQHEKARRLARVLASDIAIYNREKKDRGLAEGNLVAVLGYEIKKSWEIYKERVGADFANTTPHFRDALNDLLAEGKKIF